MKENKELEKSDLCIDANMDVDVETGVITAYVEAWFDVDRKFGTHILDSDTMSLNLYADYSPGDDSLKMFYQVETDDSSEFFDYVPTDTEAQLIKEMITQKIREEYDQSPQEFCEEACGGMEIGGIS